MPKNSIKEVVIIGCGLAGLSAAVKLAENGIVAHVISPSVPERAQSVMAMGGINVAFDTKNEGDSPEQHMQDTMKSGLYINDEQAVAHLAHTAPEIVTWLKSIGVNFALDKEGRIDLRKFGGQSKIRTAYAGARTGKQIATALIAKAREYDAKGLIQYYIGYRFYDLILNGDECLGSVIINEESNELKAITADGVIVASGGLNGLFGKTTGSALNDGYTTSKLFSLGVQLSNLEMIQYHPTTVQTGMKQMLITEAARGAGGRLYTMRNNEKWYFMEEWYPEKGALMPRDVVSQSIYKVLHDETTCQKVYLDITHLDDALIDSQLDEVVSICTKYLNLDPHKEPIPVYPGIHYFMGGIKTDASHKTNIKRLFAAGECSSQYHGANRLGGNSLLGAVCGGITASTSCMELEPIDASASVSIEKDCMEKALKDIEHWKQNSSLSLKNYQQMKDKLTYVMNETMNIYRNEASLLEAYRLLEQLESKEIYHSSFYKTKVFEQNLLLAKGMVKSAIERRESRGAHQRTDYPGTLEEYKKASNAIYKNKVIEISFE